MGRPTKEATYEVRMRESAMGVVDDIMREYGLSRTDAASAAVQAWLLLSTDERRSLADAESSR